MLPLQEQPWGLPAWVQPSVPVRQLLAPGQQPWALPLFEARAQVWAPVPERLQGPLPSAAPVWEQVRAKAPQELASLQELPPQALRLQRESPQPVQRVPLPPAWAQEQELPERIPLPEQAREPARALGAPAWEPVQARAPPQAELHFQFFFPRRDR